MAFLVEAMVVWRMRDSGRGKRDCLITEVRDQAIGNHVSSNGPGLTTGPVGRCEGTLDAYRQNDSTARRASGSSTPQLMSSSVSSVGDLS